MDIYLSGSYSSQQRLKVEAQRLQLLNHNITSTWLNEGQKPDHLSEDQWFKDLALKDLSDLSSADCIIMDCEGTSTTGGRYVEWGFALGRFGMLKLLVGLPTKGVFTQLADQAFLNWNDVITYFEKEHNAG